MIHTSRALATTYLTAAIADPGGSLFEASLGLMKGTVPEDPTTLLAAIDEADFEGYAAVEVANWVGPGVRQDLVPYVETDDCVFEADAVVITPNTITGWFLYKGANLLAWGDLEVPIVVDRGGQIVFARGQFPLVQRDDAGFADALSP